jgi:processive 1,2-diacylglycerol beta-glucosyltransferase
MGVIKRMPQIWEYLYDNPKVIKASQKIKENIHKSSHKKFKPLFDEFKPDVVICTQAFPCGMVADYKKANNLPVKVVGVLTDFAPHLYWLHDGVDYYIVPFEDAKKRYIHEGVKENQLKVFGIPIRMKFAETLDRKAIAHKLHLDINTPTVLVMGGGQGLGPMKEAVKSLIGLHRDLQIIVIAGTNIKLLQWIKKAQAKTSKKIVVYDYASNVDELMEISTLIISKPGGMTTSECLAKGLPMVVIDPIPGQEERNSDFLVKNGIAVRVDDKKKIAEAVQSLLNNPAKLRSMREAALKFGRPNAAEDIAKLVLTI